MGSHDIERFIERQERTNVQYSLRGHLYLSLFLLTLETGKKDNVCSPSFVLARKCKEKFWSRPLQTPFETSASGLRA